MAPFLHVSVVLDLFNLFYLFSSKNALYVRFFSAAIFSFVNLNFKLFCKSLNIICYFCKIVSCWYFLCSPLCKTSGVFRSACGLKIACQVTLN